MNLFSTQINDIQKRRLSATKYESILLHKTQISNTEILSKEEKQNTYEIVVIANGFEEKSTAIDDEFEEFELLEVDHNDDEPNIEDQIGIGHLMQSYLSQQSYPSESKQQIT